MNWWSWPREAKLPRGPIGFVGAALLGLAILVRERTPTLGVVLNVLAAGCLIGAVFLRRRDQNV